MEPEIIALARRMFVAFHERWKADDPRDQRPIDEWDDLIVDTRRGWLAAALVARPDLAEGVTVEAGHWAAGVLAATTTSTRRTAR